MNVHRQKQRDVLRRREEAVAKRRERLALASKKRASTEDDLFGSDDEAEGGEGGREGGKGDGRGRDDTAGEAAAAAAIPEHRIPSRLLNNAAVLFYRCRQDSALDSGHSLVAFACCLSFLFRAPSMLILDSISPVFAREHMWWCSLPQCCSHQQEIAW